MEAEVRLSFSVYDPLPFFLFFRSLDSYLRCRFASYMKGNNKNLDEDPVTENKSELFFLVERLRIHRSTCRRLKMVLAWTALLNLVKYQ